MFNYIRPVKYNVKILNGRKAPTRGIGLVMIKTPKRKIIIPLWKTYYKPQNTQNKISQASLKHNNQFRSIRKEETQWLKLKTDLGKKLKFEKDTNIENNIYLSLPQLK